MNVNNRKLFANRDARRRLSEMGGIVSSYPELMGVAQQFNAGGRAEASQPYTYQDWQGMSRIERADAGLPVSPIGGAMFFNRFMRGMGLASETGEIGVQPEALPPFLRERPDDRTVVPVQETGGLAPEALDNARMINVGPVPYLVDPATGQGFRMDGMPVSDAEQMRISEVVGSPEFEEPVQTMADTRVSVPEREFATAQQELEDVLARPSRGARDDARIEEARAAAAAAEARVAAPTSAAVLTPEALPTIPEEDAAPVGTTPTGDTPRPRPRPQQVIDDVAAAMEGSDDPSADAASAAINDLTGEPAADTVQGRISQYEQIFQEMFGESDEDKTREKYLNLAMIGFAIASGEDPSALRNIASGLLQGTAQMQENAATRRQREDRIQELAVAAGLEDDRLAQRLAASEREALLRAAGSADGTRFSPTEPFVDAVRSVAESAMTQGLYSNIEEALAASSAALRPFYSMGEESAATPGGDAQPDLGGMQAAEEAAREAGSTEFVFNGMRYPVR